MLDCSEFEVVGEAASGREGARMAASVKPRIVLLDIRMPDGDGLEALQEIKVAVPQTAVVMLTTYNNPAYVDRAIAGGAAGYLMKGIDSDELLAALRKVANGEMLLQKEELQRSLKGVSRADRAVQTPSVKLSSDEREMLSLVSAGLSNEDIAAVLPVTVDDVKTSLLTIIAKLHVSDRVQAAVWAARYGMAVAAL